MAQKEKKAKLLTPDETAYLCEQLAMMLGSGMQLADGLELIAQDAGDLSGLCAQLAEDIGCGTPLHEAMEKSRRFPAYAVSMARIGFLTGSLEDVLRGLSDYYEERAEMTRTVRSAVLHPIMLLVMMTVVMIVLIVMVIPMFGDIFSQFDSSVGETVSAAVNLAYRTGGIILAVLIAVTAAALVIAALSQIPAAREALARFTCAFPLTKNAARKFTLAKFTKAVCIMTAAGIPADEILENVQPLVSDVKMKAALERCRQSVLEGESFPAALDESGVLPRLCSRSLIIAYGSGSFEAAWRKISERCADEAEQTAATAVGFIEPAIIIILAALIGAILLTVMLPLMDIMSALG